MSVTQSSVSEWLPEPGQRRRPAPRAGRRLLCPFAFEPFPTTAPLHASFVMQDFRRIVAWRRARALTIAIHEASRTIRPQAAPGLRSQLLRATMSISATIAEGAGRESRVDFAQFIMMAIGSTSEVEHHLTVCSDLELVDRAVVARLSASCDEIRKMLFCFRRTLLEAERRISSQPEIPTANRSTADS